MPEIVMPTRRITLHAKNDPLEAGEMLLHYLARYDDPIELTPGGWQFDRRVIFPKGAWLVAPWRAAVRLTSSATDSDEGCLFELADGVRISGLTLDGYSLTGKGDQNQVVGFANDQADCKAGLDDCNVWGRSFGVYVWALAGNVLDCERVNVRVGRWGVTAGGGSAGANSQLIRLRQCNVVSDFDMYRGAGGEIGDGAVCLVARGGVIEMMGGTLSARGSALKDPNTGQPYISRVHCAWTTDQGSDTPYAGGDDWPAIVFKKDHEGVLPAFSIAPNGSAIARERQQDIGIIQQAA